MLCNTDYYIQSCSMVRLVRLVLVGVDVFQQEVWLICRFSFTPFTSSHQYINNNDQKTYLCVFLVNDAKGKQKVLGSNQKLKFNPTELILYCKDFRIIRFRFDEAGPESAKKVHNTCITHFSQSLATRHTSTCPHTSAFHLTVNSFKRIKS